jgi:hypothetical protein
MPGATPDPGRKTQPREPLAEADLWPTHKLPLRELRAHVKAVLAAMVENRDVKWDERGRPIARAKGSGETAEYSWVHYEVDLSAIGMPTNSPLIVCSHAGDNFVTWNLGPVLIAGIPKEKSPKDAADTLNMDTLLEAFRRFVVAESGR